MSIAESLGVEAVDIIIKQEKISEEKKRQVREIPTILRAAALLHDMGNPPFGHLGEEIIGDWFKTNLPRLKFDKDKKLIYSDTHQCGDELIKDILIPQMQQDLMNFEGNAQLLRLITKLNNVVDDKGMNLTFPVLATILKYPRKSTEKDPEKKVSHKKMGYMYSEREVYDKINKKLDLSGNRHPLAFLLEAADDIAYLTADIEDAHKKGLISLSAIKKMFEQNKDDNVIAEILKECNNYEEQWQKWRIPEHDNYIIQRLRIFMKGKMISAVKNVFNDNYKNIMEGKFEKELLSASTAMKLVELIRREIEVKYIYYSRGITRTKLQSYQILDTLMSKFIPCVFNHNDVPADDKDTLTYHLISNNYRYVCEKDCAAKKYNDYETVYYKLLLVTDFISGMTDTYAMDMYRLLIAQK